MENIKQLLFTGFGAAILAAVLFGLREIIDKYLTKFKRVPFYTVLIGQFIFSALFLSILVLWQKQFTLNLLTIIYALIGALILSLAMYLHLKSITIEDFSLTLPYLSLTFIFLIPIEYVIFRQLPAITALLGIALIIIGSFLLGYVETKEKKIRWHFSKGTKLMIIVALFYSLAGNLDKLGTLSSSSLGYLFWSYTLIVITYLIFYSVSKKNHFKNLCFGFKKYWPWLLIISLIGTFASWLLMNAYSVILVNYAISIKRAALLIPIIIGGLIFKEKNLLKRLPGVLLMLCGAIIIILFG